LHSAVHDEPATTANMGKTTANWFFKNKKAFLK